MILDYSIEDINERVNIIEQYLKDNEDIIEKYFYTCHLKQSSLLSEEMYMGRILNRCTNYLLSNKTFKYKNGFEPVDTSDEDIDYEILQQKRNFKLKKETKVTINDIEIYPILNETQRAINHLSSLPKEQKTTTIRYWIKDLKQNMIDLKEIITRPISFTKITGSYPLDYNYVYDNEFWRTFVPIKEKENIYKLELDLFKNDEGIHRKNWMIMLQLLCFKSDEEFTDNEGNIGFTTGISQNIDNHIKLFYKVIEHMKLNSFEERIIEVCKKGKRDKYFLLESENENEQKKCMLTCEEIAKEMNISPKNLYKIINRFCDKLSIAFEEYFIENIYYLYLVKGKYKRCKKCGQNKLLLNFGIKSDNADGYKTICKDCEGENKKYCTNCNRLLDYRNFGKDTRNRDGLQTICKRCDNLRKKE